ncbi:response regulator [Terriglobus roseus]|uniref:Response regulator receiver protein n=1 Tax=Terriglobus roseus TaxID=392734 RepID=A0A1H4N0S9_9BACT|nr:response regulator [Terriglobus roseus]SEB88833.1 response regulator receiver protein [Terriglobus roseus]
MQFSGIRTYVVDDDVIVASSLAAILRLHGFWVKSFTDPTEALASALSEPPELLVSDIVMPALSGIELALQIKALCPTCKILLFSGEAANVDFHEDAERIDANLHIIPKPMHPSKLLEVIWQKLKQN